MTTKPNIVVVVLDTTRADDAFDPAVAPTLADIGSAGTRVTQAISPAPWTLPSHVSLLTGTYPSKHGAHADHERMGEELPTLPGLLSEAGYETACVSNNTWLSVEAGFDRGFDTFRQMWQIVQSDTALSELVDVTERRRLSAVAERLVDGNPLANLANVCYRFLMSQRGDYGGERTTSWIADWLAGRDDDRPFFLLANYLEPHLEYRPPRRLAERYLPAGWSYDDAMEIPQEPWEYLAGKVTLDEEELRALRGLYRAEIAAADEQVAEVKRALIAAGELDDTILLVTADHGENVGHHGMMDHQYCLYDSLVHVPLVAQGGAFTDGEDVTALTSLVDVAPTLLDAAGVEAPDARAGFQGRSFHPRAAPVDREFVISEYMAPQPSMDALERHVGDLPQELYEYDRSLRAIRTPSYKLVRGSDGTRDLYDLDADPEEERNVAEAHPGIVDSLATRLDEWLDGFDRPDREDAVTIDGTRKQQLEELGYLQ